MPYAGLIQAANGNLYGTTFEGGSELDGTVFKITPNGTLTTLHSFSDTDGEHPTGALVQATDGDFYGTTLQAGAKGYGTVFKITPSGTLTTLYSFCSAGGFPCSDGENPYGGLIQATNGDLYGTTQEGATLECGQVGCGTVFEITPTGTLTTLHHFVGTDGWQPHALVRATDGNLYGTTALGGPAYVTGGAVGWGTIFKITPSRTLTTLYSFCAQGFPCADGANPYAGLVQATDGSFYGTAESGGVAGACMDGIGCGAVFSLSVGLGPFVETQPASGEVGAAVKILGTDLTGASSVTFNGTPAAITFVSPSEISTAVPSGATTGKVAVTTDGMTLLSNAPFRVLP